MTIKRAPTPDESVAVAGSGMARGGPAVQASIGPFIPPIPSRSVHNPPSTPCFPFDAFFFR
ncbi:hypothetical protein GGP49_000883 [Salinibacter ruber]|nr:hypothetical protein [Salinibacter ruber]